MFTQPCFIKKNTQGLRLGLDLLGYKPMQSIIPNREDMLFVKDGYFMNNFPYDTTQSDKAIDCGNNESLFFALAALRDDTDYMQWFKNNKIEYWIQCTSEVLVFYTYLKDKDKYVETNFSDNFHKATVQELIEHFK